VRWACWKEQIVCAIAVVLFLMAGAATALAQTDEIQVYDADIAELGVFNLMVHNKQFHTRGTKDASLVLLLRRWGQGPRRLGWRPLRWSVIFWIEAGCRRNQFLPRAGMRAGRRAMSACLARLRSGGCLQVAAQYGPLPPSAFWPSQ
jgi:hypothetical protein